MIRKDVKVMQPKMIAAIMAAVGFRFEMLLPNTAYRTSSGMNAK